MKLILAVALWFFVCVSQFPQFFAISAANSKTVAAKTAERQLSQATDAPLSYEAISSTDTIPYPSTPPTPQAAGSILVEPEFNVQVLRVTDKDTMGNGYPNWDFVTPGSAMQNTFSTDSKLFYVIGDGMHILFFQFDPAALTSKYTGLDLGRKYGWGDTSFSTTNPNVAYGLANRNNVRIDEFDFSTHKERTVLDPSKCLKYSGTFRGLDISVSAGDSRILGVFGPQEDADPYLVVWDARQGCRWYNTATGDIGGDWGPKGQASTAQRFGVHQARISLSGEYAVIAGGGSRHFWNVDTLQVTDCAKDQLCDGHFAIGYNKLVNTPGTKDDMHVVIRSLTDAADTTDLIDSFPGPAEWDGDSHWSWNNDNVSDTSPVCGSTYLVSNPTTPGTPLVSHRAWDNEVICFATTGSQKVWRFAHTYSTAHNGFYSTPRGNVSQDGRFYMFSSDWEDELGKDSSGHYRTDVFIIPLK
jgi:hypothetical protein